ncbi:MAG: hypothetical protein AAF184_11125 [Pseudomonadota bacterium]
MFGLSHRLACFVVFAMALAALPLASPAEADTRYRDAQRHESRSRVYYDYAPVVDVRALREAAPLPAACLPATQTDPQGLPELGVVREFAASIASAIVQEAEAAAHAREQARERREACERERMEPRVSGYEVTYRYRGEQYRRVMTRDPGDEVRVRVEVRTH